jgi:hypothetical protein
MFNEQSSERTFKKSTNAAVGTGGDVVELFDLMTIEN